MENTSTSVVRGASVGLRAVAVIINSVILFALFYLVAAMTGQTTEDGFELDGAWFFVAVLIYFAYYVVLEAVWAATPGKFATGLRVVREDGAPFGWRDSVIRNVLRIVDGFCFYLVGAILVWLSARRQRLGDRIAETLVVRRSTAPTKAAAA